jgi:hypothetical protein
LAASRSCIDNEKAIFAAFITRLNSSPKIATTGIHQRNAVRHPFDRMDSASAASSEAIKSATFAPVEPANQRYAGFQDANSEIYSPSRKLNLCIPRQIVFLYRCFQYQQTVAKRG